MGRHSEAHQVYKKGVRLGLFPSVYQRSIHNLAGITAKAWWTVEQSGCSKHLRVLFLIILLLKFKFIERQWTVIREEALNIWNNETSKQNYLLFNLETDYSTSGEVRALFLRQNGKFVSKACKSLPFSCQILEEAVSNSKCFKDEVRIFYCK